MTSEEADTLIDYFETLQERTNHQSVMKALKEKGYSEDQIDRACRTLGLIAGRDFSVT